MQDLIPKLAVFVLFLVLLFFILREKQRYLQYYPQSRRVLMLGAILLVLAGGKDLVFLFYQGQDVLTPRWQQVIDASAIFGYLAGGGLVLSGFLKWWGCLLEGKNHAAQRLRQLACLKSILSVINHRGDLEELFKESLPVLVNLRGYEMGVVYTRSFNSPEMTLVAHHGAPAEKLFILFDLYSKNMWYSEALKSQEITTTTDIRSLPEYETLLSDQDQIESFACVPIKFEGKVLGLMGIYDSMQNRFSYQEIQFLTSVGETLGLAAKRILTCNKNKKRKDYISAIESMLKINQEADSLEEAFPRITTELKKIIDFDHISLDLAGLMGQDLQRISIGTSGGMLVDKKAVIPQADGIIEAVMKSREVRIDRDIDPSENGTEDKLVKACGIRTRMMLPLEAGDCVYGVLCLGHKKPNFYSANDAKWLRLFVVELSHLIEDQRLEEQSKKRESLNRSLYEFERKLTTEEDLKKLLQDAAARLTSDLPKSFARITLLSPRNDELINCAACQIRGEGIDLKNEERFVLNSLPWHRLVLEAKRPMLINQDDPESLMAKEEAKIIMDEKLCSALLVPLIINDKAVGIVSVGEMRNWNRQPLTPEEMDFVNHKANQISLALKKGILRRSNERLREELKDYQRRKRTAEDKRKEQSWLADLSYQISNPLTIIRGAAELLKLTETDLGPDSLRYIRNIENGVDRIQESLKELLSPTEKEIESNVNQPAEEVASV
jgi:GAF domain-containing protein